MVIGAAAQRRQGAGSVARRLTCPREQQSTDVLHARSAEGARAVGVQGGLQPGDGLRTLAPSGAGGGAHLPQPSWFAGCTVSVEDGDPRSTLALYRQGLALRRLLQTGESLEWIKTGRDDVLGFRRPNGWTVFTNFGEEPYQLPEGGATSLSSRHFEGRELPGETTVWISGA